GGIEHHFYLTASRNGQELSSRYYRASGVGAGLFAGYDLPVASRLRLGVEAEATFGGATPTATFTDGTTFFEKPRYGYRLVGRAGYVAAPRLMIYASGGYGGNRYRLGGTAAVADAHQW